MRSVIKYLLMAALVFAICNSYAQTPIFIKEKGSNLPVAQASYQYGHQKGQSASDGSISINVQQSEKLLISHISYQPVQLNAAMLQTAIAKGFIEVTPSEAVSLNPVMVYALKGKDIKESVKLTNGDWVHHDAGQVLQQAPGLSAVKKSGASSFDPVFRGFKLDQLNILNDGALATLAACPSRMDPPTSQVLMSQVQQIEILKGPHSFRYGPSMGAVINFKSAQPEFCHGNKTFGRVSAGYESNGEIYRTEGIAGFRNKKLQLTASGAYSKGHNYLDGNDSIIPARFGRGSLGITADLNINPANTFSLSANRNFARNTDFPVLMMDLVTDDTWMLMAQYKSTPVQKWYSQWHTQVFYSTVDHLMENKFRPNSVNMLASTLAKTNTNGERTEIAVFKNKYKLYFGLDLKNENIDGDRSRKMLTGMMAGKTIIDTIWQKSSLSRKGAFAEWHYQLQRYKLSLSGRLDHVNAKAENPASRFKLQYKDNEHNDINFSFSAGLSTQWNNKWQTGLWLGRGLRSASISERYTNYLQVGMDPYEMMGNPALKPEANNQADLLIGYKADKTALQLNGYASIVTNYISSVIDPTLKPIFGAPGVRRFINVDKATLAGFEFSWQQHWLPELQQQLTAAYTWGKNNGNGNPLPEIAPLDIRYRLEGKLFENKLSPYLQVRYAAKQSRVAKDFGEKVTPQFSTTDVGVKTYFIENLQVTLAVNNLFDKAYKEHLSRYIRPTLPLNSPGRSFVVMAMYNF